ncbi:hypothetical protein Zmor_024244 [Zophobas morio]|uniref:Uncharacterized protein n=1 Tax=Zophobas morio TaxID=2755281 RepID=A0AA38HZY0_9CUCU|nr:hypothetical protein Zmor_024244 [Zophobas morio]
MYFLITRIYTIMYKTIPGQLHWVFSTFAGLDLVTEFNSRCLDYTNCSRRWFPFKQPAVLLETPTSPLLDFSGAPIRDFRFQAFLRPPSPTMSHRRCTYENP